MTSQYCPAGFEDDDEDGDSFDGYVRIFIK